MHCLKCGSLDLKSSMEGSISCNSCGYKQSIGSAMDEDIKSPKIPDIAKNKIFDKD